MLMCWLLHIKQVTQSGKQCGFLHFWTFHWVAVMKVDMSSMTSCQWAAFLSSCTSEVTGLLMTSSGFIAGLLLLLLCSPQGSPPSIQADKQLTQHGWLNAWLASLLIVLNQEMWGIKMQQVSSCMPSGVHFVRQSDEAERKKRLMLHTHTLTERLCGEISANAGWFVCEMIMYSVYMSSRTEYGFGYSCRTLWDNNSKSSHLQSTAIFSTFIFGPTNGPQAYSDFFLSFFFASKGRMRGM